MCINSFINSRNRILFRFPIYRDFRSGERNINTVKNYTSGIGCSLRSVFFSSVIQNDKLKLFVIFLVMRQTLFLNHINCRQKSSAIDGNIHSLQIKAATRAKTRKFRMLKTNVTQGMNENFESIQNKKNFESNKQT